MQSNATQIARAIAQLYTLTGSFDAPGGNVLFPALPSANVGGEIWLSAKQRARALGLRERPLGPSRWQMVTSDEIYRGILEQQPYAVRGLVGFGANLLLAHADGGVAAKRWRRLTSMSMPTSSGTRRPSWPTLCSRWEAPSSARRSRLASR